MIGCTFSLANPVDLELIFRKDILASWRTHTRGNPSSKILYGVVNPERFIQHRLGKERISTSQFEGSISQEFHSFQNLD